MYQTELRIGTTGSGTTCYCLFVMDGTKTVAVHRFTTKSEAKAFHKSGANYKRLVDLT